MTNEEIQNETFQVHVANECAEGNGILLARECHAPYALPLPKAIQLIQGTGHSSKSSAKNICIKTK